MINGVYSDGKTAARRKVAVAVEGSGLRITGDGVDDTWPIRDIQRAPSFTAREPRFQLAGNEARLAFSGDGALRLAEACPDLFRRKGMGLAAIGITGLAIFAFGTLAMVFWFAPAISGPLARATPPHVEASLGVNSAQLINLITRPCAVPDAAQREAEALADRLSQAANSPFATDLHFVSAAFPNAFALPGGRIVVTDQLIAMFDSPDQLAGVMAHETAHIARRHMMAALIRELGGAMVLDLLLGGGSGAGQQIALAGLQLQSLSHGRSAEAEADELAVVYLVEIGVDPMALSAFFERIGEAMGGPRNTSEMRELLSSHPSTARRAQTARDLAAAAMADSPGTAFRPALSEAAWQALKDTCG